MDGHKVTAVYHIIDSYLDCRSLLCLSATAIITRSSFQTLGWKEFLRRSESYSSFMRNGAEFYIKDDVLATWYHLVHGWPSSDDEGWPPSDDDD